MQPGDVPATFADTALLTEWTDCSPGTPIREGVRRFADWYRELLQGIRLIDEDRGRSNRRDARCWT